MNTLVHIAPQLPPAVDGVGDYCWNLWRHSTESDVRWEFLALHGVANTREHWREVGIRGFQANADSLHRALETTAAQTVVLHYVGYGFQPKGIPIWLPEALRRWRGGGLRRLVVMFHEMYARSSPLRSPFWVAPFARGIIRDLVHLSDAWVTSCDRYFNQLTNEFSAIASQGHLIPIGSNIPVVSGGFKTRRQTRDMFRVVIFGLGKTRLWALERHWRLLRALSERGFLDGITLLGKQGTIDDERIEKRFAQRIGPAVIWCRRFDLPSDNISQELLQHDLGFVANEPDILTKSGVFAALANHGVIPVVSLRGSASLPAFVREAVLGNDDCESIPKIVQALGDAERLETLRNNLLALASRELSWVRIAQSWSEVLQKALVGTSRRDVPTGVPAGGMAPVTTQRVPASEVPA